MIKLLKAIGSLILKIDSVENKVRRTWRDVIIPLIILIALGAAFLYAVLQ